MIIFLHFIMLMFLVTSCNKKSNNIDTKEGQRDYMISLTQEVISAGGKGIMYWEPAWITFRMKDPWGTGSSWENATFFDFEGNTLPVVEYLHQKYETQTP